MIEDITFMMLFLVIMQAGFGAAGLYYLRKISKKRQVLND
jgi:hypothetical protein